MFERGSEWRRWDLHIHTPNTKKNDNYKGDTLEEKWENFYSAVETYVNSTDERKKVSVIGITDYLSIENYKKVISDGILSKNVLAIFPNVEMRIMPTGKKSPVNMHFIFNPDFVDQLENRFFSQLEFVERFPEFSLFYRLFSPLDSEMICIFPYFYPCEESAREIREIFI